MTRALFVLVLLAGRAAADAPPIDVALAKAAAAKKLLVIEFGATWCAPCRFFETAVLTDASVIAALESVVFVRYDVDTPIGAEAQKRLSDGRLPTFVVVDPAGRVLFRHSGIPQQKTAAVSWFLSLVNKGDAPISPIERLRAHVQTKPTDTKTRMTLAHVLRRYGNETEALEQYRILATSADRIVAAEAEAVIVEIESANKRLDLELAAAMSFATQYPESPITSKRLALLVITKHARQAELEELIAAHIAAVRPLDRPDALRVALLAGAPHLATTALTRWTAGEQTALELSRAEIHLHAGERDEAKQIVDAVCDAAPGGVEAWCFGLQMALRSASSIVPEVQRLRMQVFEILDDLRHPGSAATEQKLDRAVANAVARAVMTAEKDCAVLAHATRRVQIHLALSKTGGRPTRVRVMPGDSTGLARCLIDSLETANLPAPAITDDTLVQTTLYFKASQQRIQIAPSSSVGHGVAFLVTSRTGAVDTAGFSIDSMIDITSFAGLRLTSSLQIEGGVDDASHGAYASRVFLGAAATAGSGVVLDASVGVGLSKYGNVAERAFEVPLLLRLRFGTKIRTHIHARGSFFPKAESRMPGDKTPLLGTDEIVLGAALSVPFGETRMMFGFAYEDRAAGQSASIMFGVPLGSFF